MILMGTVALLVIVIFILRPFKAGIITFVLSIIIVLAFSIKYYDTIAKDYSKTTTVTLENGEANKHAYLFDIPNGYLRPLNKDNKTDTIRLWAHYPDMEGYTVNKYDLFYEKHSLLKHEIIQIYIGSAIYPLTEAAKYTTRIADRIEKNQTQVPLPTSLQQKYPTLKKYVAGKPAYENYDYVYTQPDGRIVTFSCGGPRLPNPSCDADTIWGNENDAFPISYNFSAQYIDQMPDLDLAVNKLLSGFHCRSKPTA